MTGRSSVHRKGLVKLRLNPAPRRLRRHFSRGRKPVVKCHQMALSPFGDGTSWIEVRDAEAYVPRAFSSLLLLIPNSPHGHRAEIARSKPTFVSKSLFIMRQFCVIVYATEDADHPTIRSGCRASVCDGHSFATGDGSDIPLDGHEELACSIVLCSNWTAEPAAGKPVQASACDYASRLLAAPAPPRLQ